MNSSKTYNWHDHDIKIQASASLKYLWLDYKFNVSMDDTHIKLSKNNSIFQRRTKFFLEHAGKKFRGEIISSTFPCSPIVFQSTIIDDCIIGYSQLRINHRALTYLLLSLVAYTLFL